MAFQTLSCPECGATVKSSAPAGKTVRCPKCKNTFRVEEEDPPAPAKKADAIKKPGAPAAAGKSRHREDDLEPSRRDSRAGSSREAKTNPLSTKTKMMALAGVGA